jgi:hypothetical protein
LIIGFDPKYFEQKELGKRKMEIFTSKIIVDLTKPKLKTK